MKNIIVVFILLFSFLSKGQETLTLDQAKAITLENNYGILIAKNNSAIASNMTKKSMNGYLPTVSATGGMNSSLGGSSQKFSSGQEASTSNALTWGGNASIGANYTIFDKRRSLTLEQLKENLSLTDLQLLQTIEQNLLQVYLGFYQVAQLTENVAVLYETIEVSKERRRRAQDQLEFGQGTRLDVLNAEVDIQRDSVNILNALMNLNNAKRDLNVSMGRNSSETFNVSPQISLSETLNLEALIAQSKEENITIKINRQRLIVDEMNLKIIDAEKTPTLSSGASYDYNYTDSPSGSFIDISQSRGLGVNVGVSWNIFDGSRKLRKQNAVINLNSQKLQIEQVQQQLERDISNAWANYQNAIFVLDVEKNAVETNRENFERTEEQVQSGQLNSINFRQAQLNLLNAQTSLNNANFDAKIREIQLLQMVGRLID